MSEVQSETQQGLTKMRTVGLLLLALTQAAAFTAAPTIGSQRARSALNAEGKKKDNWKNGRPFSKAKVTLTEKAEKLVSGGDGDQFLIIDANPSLGRVQADGGAIISDAERVKMVEGNDWHGKVKTMDKVRPKIQTPKFD